MSEQNIHQVYDINMYDRMVVDPMFRAFEYSPVLRMDKLLSKFLAAIYDPEHLKSVCQIINDEIKFARIEVNYWKFAEKHFTNANVIWPKESRMRYLIPRQQEHMFHLDGFDISAVGGGEWQ